MKNLIIGTLLSASLISASAVAGPTNRSDKLITGLIVGATAAAIVTAIAHADEVKVYQTPPKHFKPKPHYNSHRHWKGREWHHKGWRHHERRDWRERRFDQREHGDRRWRH